MRRFKWCGLLALVCATVGCQAEGPAPEVPAGDQPPAQFLAAPVPRAARPKFPFGPPAAYPKSPDADRALDALDTAFDKAWDALDPRERLAELIRTSAQLDGSKTCGRVRAVSLKLQKLNLPPQRRVVWEPLAEAVAAWDIELRDDLLLRASAEGRRALKDDALWKPDPIPPGAMPIGNPQTLRDFEKHSLEYRARLWKVVVDYRHDRAAALDAANTLFTEAKARGLVPLGCISRSHDYTLAEDLAELDPVLLLAVLPKVWNAESTAPFCGSYALRRWQDRKRDGITGMLATHAVTNGYLAHLAEVMAYYDRTRMWEQVAKLPDDTGDGNFPRSGPLVFLAERWAWEDPEAALEAAENEKSAYTRRMLIQNVAKVWVFKRPEQIERALKNLDNDYERNRMRKMAASELEWRKQGNPPRDTSETAPEPWRW